MAADVYDLYVEGGESMLLLYMLQHSGLEEETGMVIGYG